MHEQSAAQKLISIILEESLSRDISPSIIHLDLGRFTTYKKEPILFYYEAMRPKNLANTQLIIREIPGIVHCNSCGEKHQINEEIMMFCPVCQSLDVKIVQGREFTLTKMVE